MLDIFIDGETTGQKAVPEDVISKMRSLRVDGKKHFSPSEYLRVTQVKSLFSRFAKQKREGTLKEPKNPSEVKEI